MKGSFKGRSYIFFDETEGAPIGKANRSNLRIFLGTLDNHLAGDDRVELYLGGAGAILLAYGGQVATEDLDFIGEESGLLLELSQLAGKDSDVHRLTNYYLDILPPGRFPSAMGWKERTIPVKVAGLRHIELRVLEVHDLIVSKLKRFGSQDQENIRTLCDHPEFDASFLLERYREARKFYDYDQQEKLDGNFNLVETEFLQREPTVFPK